MIADAVQRLELVFISIPLPLLEVWGRFGYLLGFFLMICAYAGITFRPHDHWGIGHQRQTWDAKAFLSMILTFLMIFVTGFIGSHVVLVPGAQTFESLKDLSVFLCLVLFGYPALLIVPFAYGLSDMIEGVPPEFLRAWLPGYFINPTCFWVAHQLFGRDPDFRKLRTWLRYIGFVLFFMALEPLLWGYLCSPQFSSEISYRTITPALFFTTGLTWIMAPFAMLLALPLARRWGFFWAEIPHHVHERRFKERSASKDGLPLRLMLVAPFIILTLTLVILTAFMALKSSENTALKLARELHRGMAETIALRLGESDRLPGALHEILSKSRIGTQGLSFILDRQGHTVAASADASFLVQKHAIESIRPDLGTLASPQSFSFAVITSKPLAHESWLGQATPYGKDWIVITATPEAFHEEGVRSGNSFSAMMIAAALCLALLLAIVLSTLVTAPIARMVEATGSLAQGDLSRRVPDSRLDELQALSQSFNTMAAALENSFHRTKLSEEMFRDLVETMPGIVWQADPRDLRILFVSQQVESLLGYTAEECQRPGFWMENVDPLDRERAMTFYRKSLEEPKAHALEYRMRSKDGQTLWLRDTVKIIQKPSWSRYLHGVMVDITDRKCVEQELEIAHMKAETALELAKAGYWHVPVDGSGVYLSSARTVEIFGDTPCEDLRYKLDADWYGNARLGDAAAADRARQNLEDALSGLVPVYDATYAYRRPSDGRTIWIHAMGKVFKNQQGKITDMFGVTQDITEFKNMNAILEARVAERTEKLIQATKNLIDSSRKAGMAEVAIGVLHNIGNALTSASIKVQNLHLDFQNDVAIQHLREAVDFLKSKGQQLGAFLMQDDKGQHVLPYLDTISCEVQKEAEAHRRLVAQLLKDLALVSQLIAKQQSNAKFTGIVENFPVVECLEDVMAIQAFDCEKYRIRVNRLFAERPMISTDRHKILQILTNIVANAIQAMHANTGERLLTLCIRELRDWVEIEIQDNGMGIDGDQMSHMFRYGYTTRSNGHGFGLHSSSIDAKLLGGQLSCNSGGRGQGASFVLRLPKRMLPIRDDVYSHSAELV